MMGRRLADLRLCGSDLPFAVAPVLGTGTPRVGYGHNTPSPLHTNGVSLDDLPVRAAVALNELLDAQSFAVFALYCVSPSSSVRQAYTRRTYLQIPPDAARLSQLTELLTRPASRRQVVVSTQIAVASTYQLHSLNAISDRVQKLVVDPRRYLLWPQLPVECAAFKVFPGLASVEICVSHQLPINLSTLSQCAPQLRQLTIRNSHCVSGDLRGMPKLEELHLSNTNIDSFSIAVGLAKLHTLALLARKPSDALHDACRLPEIAPLQRLTVMGTITKCTRVAFQHHLSTLREYADLEGRRGRHFTDLPRWRAPTHSMLSLRSLQLGSRQYRDVRSLQPLRQLEHLQIAFMQKIKHCRSLRALTSLRRLDATRLWVCDIVGFLPKLETLTCQWLYGDDVRRTRFCRRPKDRRKYGDAVITVASLRQLQVVGGFTVDDTDPVVHAMLDRISQLELRHGVIDLKPLRRLTQLKRLAVQDDGLKAASLAGIEGCACLEELFVVICYGHFLPLLRGMTSLRVFACYEVPMRPLVETSTAMDLPPHLTHLYTPLGGVHFDTIQPWSVFAQLRVVSLAVEQSCEQLRRERGPDRALPALQCILHPVTDCLWSPQCLRHQPTVNTLGIHSHDCRRLLEPKWTLSSAHYVHGIGHEYT